MLAMLTTLSVQGQVNAPIIISNDADVCADSIGGSQTLSRVDISRVGENYPEQSFYVDATGQKVVPGATVAITGGKCDGSVASSDSEIIPSCDYDEATNTGTPFLRIITIDADGVATISIKDLTGAVYVPTGTTYEGFCNLYNTADSDGLKVGNGATFDLNEAPYTEWTITNASLNAGALTTNGDTVDAITGMTWSCKAWFDPNTYIFHYCDNASGAVGTSGQAADYFYSYRKAQ